MILTKLETLALLTKANFTNTTKLRESPMEFNLKWNTTLNGIQPQNCSDLTQI